MGGRLSIETRASKFAREAAKDDRSAAAIRARQNRKMALAFLVTGPPESGKSTLLRQFQNLHQGGFTREQKVSFIPAIRRHAVRSMRTLLTAMLDYGMALDDAKRAPHVQVVLESNEDDWAVLSENLGIAIEELWDDPIIQAFADQARGYKLQPSTEYSLDNIRRIAASDYIPNEHDILRHYERTPESGSRVSMVTGDTIQHIIDTDPTQIDSEATRFPDHRCAIIYLLDLSKYDQPHPEKTGTELHESLRLYNELVSMLELSPRLSMIVFLTKVDIFKEKMLSVPLGDWFPDYQGDDDYRSGADYFFNRITRDVSTTRQIYCHFTNTLDTTLIRFVMPAINDIMMPTCSLRHLL